MDAESKNNGPETYPKKLHEQMIKTLMAATSFRKKSYSAQSLYHQKTIGVEMKMLYQSGDSEVYMGWKHPQKWKGNDFGYVNTVPHIARAQRYNKDFKVYVSCGLYDLATPCFTAENFMNDNSVDMDRVILSEFEAGHMMYNHQTSFDRFLNEVLDFIKTDK